MAARLIIFLIVTANLALSQNWTPISKSRIVFSNFIRADKDNYGDFSFEYFKKGDSLIAVAKFISKDFLDIFSENLSAFDDIYRAAYQISNKSDLKFKTADRDFFFLDSAISNLSFKTCVIINDRHFVPGIDEYIWVLTNFSGSNNDLNPCYINMVFSKRKNKRKQVYISTIKNYCEI